MIPPGRAKARRARPNEEAPDAPWHYGAPGASDFVGGTETLYAGCGTAASRRKVNVSRSLGVDDHVVALVEAAGQHLDRERVLDHPLDGALQRPRAEDRS
jgi:hypothetical protein